MFDVLGRITELKEERGWTTYRVAKNAGIPQSSIQTWYAKGINPPFDAIEKMCNAFGVTLSEFFEENKVEYGEANLAKHRKLVGLSREELAERVGVSTERIRDYEQKKRDITREEYRVIKRLASVLGCSMDDIVE